MENLNTEYLVVQGGKRLQGEVEISGAKNSALKQLAASLILSNGTCVLHNVPKLSDIDHMIEIIKILGGKAEVEENSVYLDNRELSSTFVPFSLASKFRASFVCLGALVARFKEAKIALPGGCDIGARKIDLHLKGLKALGAKITEDQGYVYAKADKLIGTKIYLDLPSNGATENIMIAAALAEGETTIENAARDPEIIDLANFLNNMGCEIRGAGSSSIHIIGKRPEDLHSFEHTTIPDRIEAATYLIAGVMTNGKVTAKEVIEEDLQSLLSKFEDIGAVVTIHDTGKKLENQHLVNITVEAKGRKLKSTDVTTMWYPGFSTDIQPVFTALLSVCRGTSMVTENIYDSRFQHVEELNRMGANMDVSSKLTVIKGVKQLSGANLHGKDLRSTASLIVAALAAKGSSEIRGLEHLDRGYERIEEKLSKLGARIHRVTPLASSLEYEEESIEI